MSDPLTNVQVRVITGQVGNFEGADIATPGAVGSIEEITVLTVTIDCTQTPQDGWEYVIRGTVTQDGFAENVAHTRMYYVGKNGTACVFQRIIPT